MKVLMKFNFKSPKIFLPEWLLLGGSWWFQTSGGFFNGILGLLLLSMIWMEFGMGDMDGCRWYGGMVDLLISL